VWSRNPVIFDRERKIHWSDLAQNLLAWLFFNPKLGPRPPATMFVLLCEAMRRMYLGQNDKHTKVQDLVTWVRGQSIRVNLLSNLVLRTDLPLPYSSVETPKKDYGSPTTKPYRLIPDHLNPLASDSNQPLSFVQVDGVNLYSQNLVGYWIYPTKRFLLNHPVSSFSASRRPDAAQSLIRDGWHPDADEPNADELAPLRFMGIIADAIRGTSDYMPPRRHCYHYDVNDHCLFFVNWYEFATEHSNRAEDDLLLRYADTIQARGCGHLWEYASITPQDRIQKARAFLDFLCDEDAVESDRKTLSGYSMPLVFRLMTESLRSLKKVAFASCPKIPKAATSFAFLTTAECPTSFDGVKRMILSQTSGRPLFMG
jgi:hypothetical protein